MRPIGLMGPMPAPPILSDDTRSPPNVQPGSGFVPSGDMRRFGIVVLYLAALCGGTYSTFRPTFDSGFARVQADAGDGMLNHYLLEHSWRVVSDTGYCGTLWSPPFFYPERLTLAYSESFLGVVP